MADNDVFDDDKFFEDLLKDDDDSDETVEKSLDDKPDDKKEETDNTDDQKDDKSNSKGPSLEDRLAALEKENKGLKKAVVEYRQERSQYKGRLDELTDIIKSGMNNRGSQTTEKNSDDTSGDNASKAQKRIDKAAVEFGEDGKAYVPADAVKDILAEELQRLSSDTDNLKKTLSEKDQAEQAQSMFQERLGKILEKSEGRDTAYEKLTKALKMLDEKVIEIQKEEGIEGIIDPGAAIDMLYNTDGALEDFEKMGLGVTADQVIRAFDSEYMLGKTLDGIVSATKEETSKDEDSTLLEGLQNKPSSPSGSKTAKRDEGVLDKVSGFSTNDLLNLDDKSWQRIERYLAEKEID